MTAVSGALKILLSEAYPAGSQRSLIAVASSRVNRPRTAPATIAAAMSSPAGPGSTPSRAMVTVPAAMTARARPRTLLRRPAPVAQAPGDLARAAQAQGQVAPLVICPGRSATGPG